MCNIIIYFFKSNALIITSRIVSSIMIIFYVWLILWGGVSKKSDNFTLISCIIFTPRYEAYSSVSNFGRPPIDQQAIFILYFTFRHVIMPSSEGTAGHNPSRISIDNGTFVQTQKNSQRYKMKVQKKLQEPIGITTSYFFWWII